MAAASLQELSERETELRRSEEEAVVAEEKLHAECVRLDSAAGATLARLQSVRAAAAYLQGQGMAQPAFAEIQQRVSTGNVPRLDVGTARGRALEARRAAVEARKLALEQLRRQVHEYAAELSRLGSQLNADEVALQQFEKQAKAQAEAARQAVHPPPMVAPEMAAPPSPPAPPSLAAKGPLRPLAPPRPEGRRGQPRVRMQAQVDLASESNFFAGFSTNISEGGLFVATVQSLPLGTPVDLQFTLPDGTRLEVQGEVRWLREVNDKTPEIFPGIGVQFKGLTPAVAEAIKGFVHAREPLFFPE